MIYGSLLDIDRLSGYWLKLEEDQSANLVGYRTPQDIEYNLNEGNNLVSFSLHFPVANKKVFAIAPPTIIVSNKSIKLFI